MSDRKRYDHELLGSSFAHNAEQAVITPQGPLNIVTPCHGAELYIFVEDGEPSHIECLEGCKNWWNTDGTVGHWQEAE